MTQGYNILLSEKENTDKDDGLTCIYNEILKIKLLVQKN